MKKAALASLVTLSMAISACQSDSEGAGDMLDDQVETGDAGIVPAEGNSVDASDPSSGVDTDNGETSADVTTGDNSSGDSTSGSTSEPSTDVGGVSRLGRISLSDASASDGLVGSADFVAFSPALPFQVAEPALAVPIDTCDVLPDGDNGGDPIVEFFENFGFQYRAISAGQVITLSSSQGTYGSLERGEAGSEIVYLPASPLGLPVPDRISVDVPGDDFPQASVDIERPSTPADFSPAVGSTIALDTVFSWTPVGSSETLVDITLFASAGSTAHIRCSAVNDGEFTIPASAVAEAAAFGMPDDMLLGEIATSIARMHRVGSALLMTEWRSGGS